MRVLVTGGAGFIGSHTVDALLADGHDVRVLDGLEPPVHTGARPNYLQAEAELIQGSVTDRDALLRALAGIEAVFHFAAYQDYLTDFSHFFLTNSAGTALLYQLIVSEGFPIKKVVVASSQAIYGEGKYCCPTHGITYPDQRAAAQLERGEWGVGCPHCGAPMEAAWTDERVVAPHNSYSLSKRDQEEIALKLGMRYGIPSVALRYSIVQGARQSFRNAYSGALRSFAVRVLNGQPPVIYEDGEQLRDYVSIHDVVEANMLVLRDSRADYEVFNVGGDRRVSVRDLARLVVEAAGVAIEPELPGLFRVGDARHSFSDVSKLQTLGWAPHVAQSEMVREYLAWASEQPTVCDTYAQAQIEMKAAGVLREARVSSARSFA